jgi:hypothetical protein
MKRKEIWYFVKYIYFSTRRVADFKSYVFYLIMFGCELEVSSIVWVSR